MKNELTIDITYLNKLQNIFKNMLKFTYLAIIYIFGHPVSRATLLENTSCSKRDNINCQEPEINKYSKGKLSPIFFFNPNNIYNLRSEFKVFEIFKTNRRSSKKLRTL